MKIIYNNYLPFKGFRAMSIYPIGVFVRNTDNVGKPISKTTVRHESIHWQQQKELLGIFFYVLYVLEWGLKLITYGSHAYKNISFEREAYSNQKKPTYLQKRKRFAWIQRLFH